MKQIFLAAIIGLGFGGSVLAQTHGVPPTMLQNTRRMDGERLTVCADVSGRTVAFDKAVAQLIADALFVQMDYKEGFGGYPTSGDGFLDELQIAMTNSCDILMGMTVQENSPFPSWAALSRPYVSLPYLMFVKEDYAQLLDIPLERKLGTALGSMGERVFITWNQQRPKTQRYARLPYADMQLMAKRVLDGSIAGGLIWAPAWADLQRQAPELTKELRTISLQPVPETVTRIGVLVKARDSYLRARIDEAIDALVADGSIAAKLDEFGYLGVPGDDTKAQ